jgi:hypothetical protein
MFVIAAGVALGIIAAVLFFAFLPDILRAMAALLLFVVALVAVIAFVVFVLPVLRSSGMTGADLTVIIAIISVATTWAALVGRFDAVFSFNGPEAIRHPGFFLVAVVFFGAGGAFCAVMAYQTYPTLDSAGITAFAGLNATLTAAAARGLAETLTFDHVRYWAGVIGAFALVYGGLAAMVAVATYIAG